MHGNYLLQSIIPNLDGHVNDILSLMKDSRPVPSFHLDSIEKYDQVVDTLGVYGPLHESFIGD